MNRKATGIIMAAVAGLLQAAQVHAAQDFSRLSDQELVRMQSQTRYMSGQDRAAYRAERQNRLREASQRQNNGDAAQQRVQTRSQIRHRLQDGSGGRQVSGDRRGYPGNTMGQRGAGGNYGRGYGTPRGGGSGARGGGGRR